MTDAQAMLMQQEGTGPRDAKGRFLPYDDSMGNPSIGWGHLLAKGIPAEIANMLFQADLADALEDVRSLYSCYDVLSRPRQLVLISMAFNLGRDKLSKWVKFSAKVHQASMGNGANWDEAADELLNSKAAREDAPSRYRQLAMMMRTNSSAWI